MRLPPSSSLLAGAVLAHATLASPALAGGQQPTATAARADALFARGKTEMAAGHIATACAALAESLALEPAEGTLLALGLCREKEGELVIAHGLLRDVAARTDRDERKRVARAALARIEGRVGRVVVNVPAGAATCAATLRLDERALPPSEVARELPVSSGSHRVACERVPGEPTWTQTVTAAPGAVATVDVPEPEARATSGEVATAARPSVVVASLAPSAPERSTEQSSIPWFGWTVAGAGVVVLGAGAFFGARAANGWQAVETKCDPSACKDASALEDARDARADARIANVAVVSGAVLVGAGILLVLTHGTGKPRTSKVTAALLGGGRVAF